LSPLPTTDADEFQDISAAQRDQLLADLREEHMMTNLTHGPDGDAKTSSWTASASKSKSSCSEHLPWLSGTKDFPTHVSTHRLKAQAEVPSQMWCRPSGYWVEMHPGKIPIYTIMLIGRWSSDAFLCYIRKQVEQFVHKVAKKMLTFCSFRYTIPDIAPRRISSEDPRQCNHHNNAETRQNIGGNK
jgi:hypothetical protein